MHSVHEYSFSVLSDLNPEGDLPITIRSIICSIAVFAFRQKILSNPFFSDGDPSCETIIGLSSIGFLFFFHCKDQFIVRKRQIRKMLATKLFWNKGHSKSSLFPYSHRIFGIAYWLIQRKKWKRRDSLIPRMVGAFFARFDFVNK